MVYRVRQRYVVGAGHLGDGVVLMTLSFFPQAKYSRSCVGLGRSTAVHGGLRYINLRTMNVKILAAILFSSSPLAALFAVRELFHCSGSTSRWKGGEHHSPSKRIPTFLQNGEEINTIGLVLNVMARAFLSVVQAACPRRNISRLR